jgi:hypothetical protein
VSREVDSGPQPRNAAADNEEISPLAHVLEAILPSR